MCGLLDIQRDHLMPPQERARVLSLILCSVYFILHNPRYGKSYRILVTRCLHVPLITAAHRFKVETQTWQGPFLKPLKRQIE
jgi:hypothetical protein